MFASFFFFFFMTIGLDSLLETELVRVKAEQLRAWYGKTGTMRGGKHCKLRVLHTLICMQTFSLSSTSSVHFLWLLLDCLVINLHSQLGRMLYFNPCSTMFFIFSKVLTWVDFWLEVVRCKKRPGWCHAHIEGKFSSPC